MLRCVLPMINVTYHPHMQLLKPCAGGGVGSQIEPYRRMHFVSKLMAVGIC